MPHIIYVLSFALEDDYSSVTHFEGFNQTKFDLSSFPNIQFILLQHFVLRNPIRLFTSSTDLSINNSSYPGQSIYLKHEELKNVILVIYEIDLLQSIQLGLIIFNLNIVKGSDFYVVFITDIR